MIDMKDLYDRAFEKDPMETIGLRAVYSTTDMSMEEYIAHLRIIAEGKE